eukprot:2998064-Pyramimonas_sp.AAC.1
MRGGREVGELAGHRQDELARRRLQPLPLAAAAAVVRAVAPPAAARRRRPPRAPPPACLAA